MKKDKILNQREASELAMKVSRRSIIINTLLAIVKLVVGFVGNSTAMISDGVHTVTDIVSTVVVIIGVGISAKGKDERHDYGMERYESIAAIVVAMILVGVGLSIGKSTVVDLMSVDTIQVPGKIAIVGAVLSIVLKEIMYRYTYNVAIKIDSDALMADAWHHRSDVLSSIGSLVGVGGAILGFPILDPIAGLIIAVLIIKAGWDIFIDSTEKLVDVALHEDKVDEMKEVIESLDYVEKIDDIRTRKFGSQSYVDVDIGVCPNMSLAEAHDIAKNVHDELEERFTTIKHVMVHVNPFNCQDHYDECRNPDLEERFGDKCLRYNKS